jgi:hypothetical protein
VASRLASFRAGENYSNCFIGVVQESGRLTGRVGSEVSSHLRMVQIFIKSRLVEKNLVL